MGSEQPAPADPNRAQGTDTARQQDLCRQTDLPTEDDPKFRGHLSNPARWVLDDSTLAPKLASTARQYIQDNPEELGKRLEYTIAQRQWGIPLIERIPGMWPVMRAHPSVRTVLLSIREIFLLAIMLGGLIVACIGIAGDPIENWPATVLLLGGSVSILFAGFRLGNLDLIKKIDEKGLPMSAAEAKAIQDALTDRARSTVDADTDGPDRRNRDIALAVLERIRTHRVYQEPLFLRNAPLFDLDEEALAINTAIEALHGLDTKLQASIPAGESAAAKEIRRSLAPHQNTVEQGRRAIEIRIGALLDYLGQLDSMLPLFETLDAVNRLAGPDVLDDLDKSAREVLTNEVFDGIMTEQTREQTGRIDEIRHQVLAQIELMSDQPVASLRMLEQPLPAITADDPTRSRP